MSITIRDFAESVDFTIKHGLSRALLGLGAPGIGKSEIVKQIAEKYGRKVIDIRLAQMSEVELNGLIYPNEDNKTTIWLTPDILPNVERDGEFGILLLDEITSATKRMQVAAYQLILDRRIGSYKLPDGWITIGLGNREDDDGVYVRLAAPLADRFEIHEIYPDLEIWKQDYAYNMGIHNLVIAYLNFQPTSFHTQSASDGNMMFATPRSWVAVSDILKIDSDVSKNVVANKITGNIGDVEASQFIQFCKLQETLLSIDTILNGEKYSIPSKQEEIILLITAAISKLHYLKDVESFSQTDKQKLTNVINFFFKINRAEFTILGLKDLVALNKKKIKEHFLQEMDDDNILDFIAENKYLFD